MAVRARRRRYVHKQDEANQTAWHIFVVLSFFCVRGCRCLPFLRSMMTLVNSLFSVDTCAGLRNTYNTLSTPSAILMLTGKSPRTSLCA
jgi:hypothetical protein